MSKDIRSYFQKKIPPKVTVEDDDDVIPESPDVQIQIKKRETRKKRNLIDSDDEEIFKPAKKKPNHDKEAKKTSPKSKNKTPNKPALKEVKAIDIFGGSKIKRTEPLVKKEKKNTETGIHSDEEFEKSLLEVDAIDETYQNTKEKSPAKNNRERTPVKSKCKESEGSTKTDTSASSSKTDKSTNKESKTKSNHEGSTKERKNSKEFSNKEKLTNGSEKSKESHHKETKKELTPVKSPNKDKLTNGYHKPGDSHRREKKDRKTSPGKEKFKVFMEDVEINKNIKEENMDFDKTAKKNMKEEKVKTEKLKDNFEEPKKRQIGDVSLKKDKGTEKEQDEEPKNKRKRLDKSLNDSVLTDEERHERRRHSAVLYQNYLNRTGPKHLGAKQIPEGTPDCLKDCAFLLTGVLDSFERDEVSAAITKFGGCVKSTMSKKVTHVLAGDDAGPAKMAKAEEFGIKVLNEDEFLQMIIDSSMKNNIGDVKSKDKSAKSHRKSPKVEAKPKRKDSFKKDDKIKSDSQQNKHDSKLPVEKLNETKSKSPAEINCDENVMKSDNESKLREPLKQGINGMSKNYSTSVASPDSVMWVDKYKPQTVKQIIGQHGDASNVKKLSNWLTKWYINRKAKLPKPSPWSKKDDGGFYKAALLSGPPGVGKTTTVALVCKELGFDVVEFNASDTRNKTLIKEQIGELLTTTSLSAYAKGDTGKQAVTKKHVLVMDEVDGMAGNEDRGGLQELIGLIKSTSVPIICMCNDRNSQKMRSLVNYCYDLRFTRPRVEQIKAAMLSICCKEGIKIPPDAMTQLIVAANQDVRQTLNLLSMWAVDPNLDGERLKKDAGGIRKDIKLGPWEAVRKVFSEEDHKKMSMNDKSDLFFYDYSLAPLFVQENYLQVAPHCPKHEVLERISRAADSISIGNLIDSRIRGSQAWGLLPTQAMFSSVIPGHAMAGHVAGQIQFPGWLGKNSRATKMQRLCQEIHAHTRLSTSGSKSSVFLDYASHLRDAIVTPLLRDKSEGIDKSLEVLKSYHLLREDLDSLTELSLWPGQRNPMILIDSKIKAAMTRTYNKKAMALPYAPGGVKKGRGVEAEGDEAGQDEDSPAEEADSDPENDALIKKKKVKDVKASSSSSSSQDLDQEKPSTSKSKKKKQPK